MNKPNLKIVLATIFILGLTLGGIFGYRAAVGAYVGDVTDIYVNPPFSEASYVVGQYNSTHYYAKNGTTGNYDYLSTNASQIINWAIGNLTSGGKIFIKAGTYPVHELSVNFGYTVFIIIQGEGANTVLSLDANSDLITLSSPTTMLDLKLVGNKATYTTSTNDGIVVAESRCILERLWIENFKGDGIVTSGTLLGVRMHLLRVRTCYGSGIHIADGTTDWEIIFSIISENAEAGLMINEGSGLIAQNHIWGNKYNLEIGNIGTVSGLRIEGNFLEGSTQHNIYMPTKGVWSSVFIGNSFMVNNLDANNLYDVIHFAPTATYYFGQNLIQSNIFFYLTVGFYVPRYWIYLGGTSSSPRIEGNSFYSPSDINGTLYYSGTLTVKNNRGYVTENSVTATNTTATTCVFNHGLAETPTNVQCSFNFTGWTSWTWTATSTQVTITVTGTLPASWTVYAKVEYQP